jgi:hypothetical protein
MSLYQDRDINLPASNAILDIAKATQVSIYALEVALSPEPLTPYSFTTFV